VRFDVNPLAVEVKGGEFLVVGKLCGVADMSAGATEPLSLHTEPHLLIQVAPADLAGAAVGDTVYYTATSRTLSKASGIPVGQVIKASAAAGDPVVFVKFAEAGEAA
jgi:predicted RecA/RadA family phage recombinase